MRAFLRILLIIILIGNCVWFLKDGGFEPAIAAVGALVTLLEDARNNKDSSQITLNQHGGKQSANYQSAGKMKITVKNQPKK